MLQWDDFYYATTKKIIVAVGAMFDDIHIQGDHGNKIKVPLFYSSADKLIDDRIQNANLDATGIDVIFPAMGFELTGMNYAPERAKNPLQKIHERGIKNQDLVSYNRVPYDLSFSVYIGAKKFEDSLKIVEQIVPFFTPEFTVTIKDREDFELETNIPIVLNSIGVDVQNDGSFDSRRIIMWTLQITASAYYYAPTMSSQRIKKTILDMREKDFDRRFEAYIHEVVPFEADKTDPHTIKETVVDDDRKLP